ncbi:Holliday junction branch migration protein RuvA [Candidatus Peregrinibacteria bacterium]|nr:Holliday junction branch migration protein RuvA [Candidatus Peregrinibacteria bacterium]
MIAYLKGTILHKNDRSLILETNGVGYEVFTTTNILAETATGTETDFFIHTQVREDEISLYGFPKYEELRFFKLLLTVNGIGPKMGMEIMSAPIFIVQKAILDNEPALLTKIKGLGKKTAERLILELKNKISQLTFENRGSARPLERQIDQDAIDALIGLGYSQYQILKVLREMPDEPAKTEDVIRYFLQKV